MAESRFSVATTRRRCGFGVRWLGRGSQGAVSCRQNVPQRPGRAAGRLPGRRVYRKAADQGYAKAQTNLGWMYANGHGLEQDYVRARSIVSAGGGRRSAQGRDRHD
jgi:hypothetical protein